MKIALKQTLVGHHQPIYRMIESSKHGIFFSGGVDPGLVEWSWETGKFIKILFPVDAGIYSLATSELENSIYAGLQNGDLHWYHFKSGVHQKRMNAHIGPIFSIKVYDQGKVLYTAGNDGYIRKWNLTNLELLVEKKISNEALRCMCLHSQNHSILVGGKDCGIYIVDKEDLMMQQRLDIHQLPIFDIAYDSRYPYVLTGSRDAQLGVLDSNYYLFLRNIAAHMFAINSLAFHPWLPLIATGSMDKTVRIWNAEKLVPIKTLTAANDQGHMRSVNAVMFNKAGDLISSGDDRLIKIWSVEP